MESNVSVLNLFIKETAELAGYAAKSYFAPITSLFDRAKREIFESKLDEAEFVEHIDDLTFIQKAVCYNQAALIEFCFLAGEKHKSLKTYYLSGNSKNDMRELQRRSHDLVNFLNETMLEVSLNNFQLLRSFFSSRSEIPPRVCLKGNFNVRNGQNATIVSLFRDDPVGYDSDVIVEGNSGFHYVRDHGRFYLENNIPAAVVKGDYVNPRLKDLEVKAEYERSGRNLDYVCQEWDNFWEGHVPGVVDDRSFYKSTLIIPLTFWNNQLSSEFKKAVGIENVERAIFGYLCFDHRDLGFFDKVKDVAVGYIFADILSVYIFNRLVYTNISKTYGDVTDLLKAHDMAHVVENIDRTRRRYSARHENILNVQSFKTVETSKNRLVPTDKELFDYVNSGK